MPYGIAQAPDGRIYAGWGDKVFAGRSSHLEDLRQVAADRSFGTGAAPIGARSDGTVVLTDGASLLGLKDGHVTTLYQAAAPVTAFSLVGFVDHDDTVWLAPIEADPGLPGGSSLRLGNVFGLSRTGDVIRPAIPADISGLDSDVARLEVFGLASDKAGGLFARVGIAQSSHQYVLHIANGQGMIVAASDVGPEDQMRQKPVGPFTADAMKIPLFLPRGIVVRPGMLILAGGTNYAIAVGLPS